jgi:hypothetical protein
MPSHRLAWSPFLFRGYLLTLRITPFLLLLASVVVLIVACQPAAVDEEDDAAPVFSGNILVSGTAGPAGAINGAAGPAGETNF